MMSKDVFEKCLDKGITMAIAESMTGGLLTYEIVKYPNASKVLICSVIAYQRQMKESILHVNPQIIDKYSIVSQEVADQMALGIQAKTQADLCISITGNAGPLFEENTGKKEAYVTILYNARFNHFHMGFTNETRVEAIKKAIDFIYEKTNNLI